MNYMGRKVFATLFAIIVLGYGTFANPSVVMVPGYTTEIGHEAAAGRPRTCISKPKRPQKSSLYDRSETSDSIPQGEEEQPPWLELLLFDIFEAVSLPLRIAVGLLLLVGSAGLAFTRYLRQKAGLNATRAEGQEPGTPGPHQELWEKSGPLGVDKNRACIDDVNRLIEGLEGAVSAAQTPPEPNSRREPVSSEESSDGLVRDSTDISPQGLTEGSGAANGDWHDTLTESELDAQRAVNMLTSLMYKAVALKNGLSCAMAVLEANSSGLLTSEMLMSAYDNANESTLYCDNGRAALSKDDCWREIDLDSVNFNTSHASECGMMVGEADFESVKSDPSDNELDDEVQLRDTSNTAQGKADARRKTEVYQRLEQSLDETPTALPGVAVLEQLRVDPDSHNTVELDQNALKELLAYISSTEDKVKNVEEQYNQLMDKQLHSLEDEGSVLSNDSQSQMAQAMEQIANLLGDRDRKSDRKSSYSIEKAIGDLKLPMLEEAEHGQMYAWETWVKATKLKLMQKASGLVELLDSDTYQGIEDSEYQQKIEHSKQLTAAFLQCFEEGTRVWDIATTVVQTEGERVDLMVKAIDAEVGRGELFRAFKYATEFFEDHWLRHVEPWGRGMAQTLSHLLLLRTRLHKENLTIDQLIVLRVAALLPDRFSWLQREIFRTDNMTVDMLLDALKPHVRAGVLASSQAHKESAVGAGAGEDSSHKLRKKDSKALAAIQQQNKDLAREIERLKAAKPLRPDGHNKGKGNRGGKGADKGSISCAHPKCSGAHHLKECPKMKSLDDAEFKRQYKSILDDFFKKKKEERESRHRQVGAAAVETELVSVPFSGTLDELFDRIELGQAQSDAVNGTQDHACAASELKRDMLTSTCSELVYSLCSVMAQCRHPECCGTHEISKCPKMAKLNTPGCELAECRQQHEKILWSLITQCAHPECSGAHPRPIQPRVDRSTVAKELLEHSRGDQGVTTGNSTEVTGDRLNDLFESIDLGDSGHTGEGYWSEPEASGLLRTHFEYACAGADASPPIGSKPKGKGINKRKYKKVRKCIKWHQVAYVTDEHNDTVQLEADYSLTPAENITAPIVTGYAKGTGGNASDFLLNADGTSACFSADNQPRFDEVVWFRRGYSFWWPAAVVSKGDNDVGLSCFGDGALMIEKYDAVLSWAEGLKRKLDSSNLIEFKAGLKDAVTTAKEWKHTYENAAEALALELEETEYQGVAFASAELNVGPDMEHLGDQNETDSHDCVETGDSLSSLSDMDWSAVETAGQEGSDTLLDLFEGINWDELEGAGAIEAAQGPMLWNLRDYGLGAQEVLSNVSSMGCEYSCSQPIDIEADQHGADISASCGGSMLMGMPIDDSGLESLGLAATELSSLSRQPSMGNADDSDDSGAAAESGDDEAVAQSPIENVFRLEEEEIEASSCDTDQGQVNRSDRGLWSHIACKRLGVLICMIPRC